MERLKQYIRDQNRDRTKADACIQEMITYADNKAIGFFGK